jgi:hypothetical protein
MNAGKLTLGLVLLTIGILASLDSLDIWNAGRIWEYWPVLLIALGLAHEVDAIRHRRRKSGYVLLAVGVWMLIGTQHFFDLSVRSAFPIGVVVVGLGVLLHAIIDQPVAAIESTNTENTHDVR